MKTMSIKKISMLAGVSPTTVSFVINNKKGVSDETRKKVLQVIEQERYIPNINSRRLSMQRSFNIAFINSESYAMFSDAFANNTIKAAVCEANKMGYSITLLPEMNLKNTDSLTRAIGQGNIDGAVVMHDINPLVFATLQERNIPVVAIDSHIQSPPYPCIKMDYEEGAYRVCRHLIDLGHRDIAYMGIKSLPDFYLRCLMGYNRALSEADLRIRAGWTMGASDDGTNVPEATRNALLAVLRDSEPPSAIFCCNDLSAIGVISGLVQMGLSVPEDVSVISIDNITVAEYFIPPLTTLHVDAALMGEKSIQLLHDIIEGRSEGGTLYVDHGGLIIRNSVIPYAQSNRA